MTVKPKYIFFSAGVLNASGALRMSVEGFEQSV